MCVQDPTDMGSEFGWISALLFSPAEGTANLLTMGHLFLCKTFKNWSLKNNLFLGGALNLANLAPQYNL